MKCLDVFSEGDFDEDDDEDTLISEVGIYIISPPTPPQRVYIKVF